MATKDREGKGRAGEGGSEEEARAGTQQDRDGKCTATGQES